MGFSEWADEKLGGVDEAIGSGVSAVGNAAGDVAQGVGNAANAAWGSVRDAGAGVFGYNTRAENEAEDKSEAAIEKGEQRRAELAKKNQALEAGHGYDPASIKDQENWQSYSHQELYNTNQNTLNQGQATEVAVAWREIGQELATIADEISHEARAAISGGWEGDAADAANRSAEPLIKWSKESGDAFRLTGNKIEEAGTGAGQVKGMVPEPQGHSPGRSVAATIATGPAGGGGDALAQMKERQEAERGAQEAMGRVYTPTYSNVDTTVPAYKNFDGKPVDPPTPPPPPPNDPPPPPVDPGGGSGGGGGGAGGGATGVPGGGSSIPGGATPPAGSGSAWAPPTGDQPGGGYGPTPPGTRPPGSGSGGDVGGVMAPPAGGAAGAGAGAAKGAGAGGMKSGGMAGGAKGAGAGMGAGGRAGVGGAASAPGAGAGASAGAGSGTGARGMGGAMGGGAGARPNQEGDEEEHDRPSWLEEHDDIWMNDMPSVAPPVLGE